MLLRFVHLFSDHKLNDDIAVEMIRYNMALSLSDAH